MRKKSSYDVNSFDFDVEPTPSNVGSKNQSDEATGEVYNSKYVNLRKSPIANGPVIGVLENGDRAVILEKRPGFYKVKVIKNGKIGYIAEHYFKED